jgi:hypothetical protein
LWRGFAVTPRPGDWSIFKNFIFEIICGHRPEINSWVLAWMARLCQDPGGDRPGTAIVLRSEAKGTGKSSFANIFGSIFGPHYIQLTSSLQIVGRFNSHLQGKVLAFADEASWGGDRNAEGVLKNLITEPYANIELKGRDLIRVRNHINLIFASNSTWVVPAGAGERRFLVLDVLPDRKGDTRFWKGMYEHMTRGGGIEAMFHDLLKIDTSTENLRYAPRTDALFDQILAGMSQNIVRAFWLETLKDGKHSFTPDSLRPCAGGTADWPTVILKDKIYEDFISFVKLSLHRYHAPSHREEFFADLKKNVDLSNFRPRINGERLCCLRIPVLEEARRQFEQIIGQPIPWVEEDEES